MSKKELVKRWALFIIGLFFSGVGVAITRRGALGVSPISSVPNVVSMRWDFLSFGTWLMVANVLMLVAQILILRQKFKLINLLQVPLSFIFGWFTDLGVVISQVLPNDIYFCRLLCSILGTATLGFGISIQVVGDVILNSGEALVKAIADTIHKEFANVKIAFDITCVTSSIVLSFIFWGKIVGAREGTIIAAVCTGIAVKIFLKIVRKPLTRFIAK